MSSEPSRTADAPRVLFRFDAGPGVGWGHFFRCLSLAEAIRDLGAAAVLAGRVPPVFDAPGAGLATIDAGPVACDWRHEALGDVIDGTALVVLDSYLRDSAWGRDCPAPLVVIADNPAAPITGDLLVLPTDFAPPDWAPDALTAPAHALIRPAFRSRRTAPKSGHRVLINFGGGDDQGFTLELLKAMAERPGLGGIEGTVIVGDVPPAYEAAIRSAIECFAGLAVECRVSDMAAAVDAHDLACGAAGGSALERCCLGLAQVVVPIVDNQKHLARALAAVGAARVSRAEPAVCAAALEGLLGDPAERRAVAEAGFGLIDGAGAERVVRAAYRRFKLNA